MALTDKDLPVLNDVVRNGDEKIIRSTRLQRVDIDELDSTSTGPLHFELPAHLQFDILGVDSDNDCEGRDSDEDEVTDATVALWQSAKHQSALAEPNDLTIKTPSETAIEALIDEIVDTHIVSLRKELRSLLERARDLP